MGYEIPVFFLPVAPSNRPWTEEDVERVISEAYEDRDKSGLRTSISRNGWHLDNVRQAAARLGSSALGFLEASSVVLDTVAITKAIQTLAAILAEASGGLAGLATTCTAEANEFFLKAETSDSETDEDTEPTEAYLRAFLEAGPSRDIQWSGDAGYSASVGYFAFLKSLFLCLAECLIEGKHFLYYSMHP